MAASFLHGVEVITVDSGSRPVQTVSTGVIGLIGTAPDADPDKFPLNTPVLIAGSTIEAAYLDTVGTGEGTLPAAVDSILDQIGAVIVVVRVEEGTTPAEQTANIIGGVDTTTGQYKGMQAFIGAENIIGIRPRILIAPGFTGTRSVNGITGVTATANGSGYTDGTYTLTVTGTGSGAVITATVASGAVVPASIKIVSPGSGYTSSPTIALPAGAGAGTGATFSNTRGTVANAIVSNMIPIAERLRAVIIADAPNTNDADALQYAADFGSKRVYVVDPQVLKTAADGTLISSPTSSVVAGLIAKTDNDFGFWWSPSNQTINGIEGTSRAVDFTLGDASSRANLLNAGNVATVIRQNGFRLWGNRTCSSDAKWMFLSVVRTADVINDSLQASHLWAVDRGITKQYVKDVTDSVGAYLRDLTNQGAILGGQCWADPGLNSPEQIAQGHVYFDFDFTPAYPAERITFRSHLVNDYIQSIF